MVLLGLIVADLPNRSAADRVLDQSRLNMMKTMLYDSH